MTKNNETKEESLMQHVGALRQCLIRSFIAVVLLFCVTSFYSKEIYAILALPLQKTLSGDSRFITTHPIEAWYTYFKTGLFTAVFFSTPVIFYQIWKFIAPGLAATERRIFIFATLVSSSLFLAGGCFGYFTAFPFAFHYFSNLIEGTGILFLPHMEDYLSFAFQMLVAFGIIFETPMLMMLLAYLGLVSKKQLSSFRSYYIVLASIIAAIFTPPDMISQMMMGIPMVLLYEVGVMGVWFMEKMRMGKKHG